MSEMLNSHTKYLEGYAKVTTWDVDWGYGLIMKHRNAWDRQNSMTSGAAMYLHGKRLRTFWCLRERTGDLDILNALLTAWSKRFSVSLLKEQIRHFYLFPTKEE